MEAPLAFSQAPAPAIAAPAATAAAIAPAGPEPPLVTVPPGAADLYSDLFGNGNDGAGTLLKTQVAEVSKRGWRPREGFRCVPLVLLPILSPLSASPCCCC